MITTEKIVARQKYYKYSYNTLMNLQKIHPTTIEVCLYMLITLNEEPNKILEFLEKARREEDETTN